MSAVDEIPVLEHGDLLLEAKKLKNGGYRLVQMCAAKPKDSESYEVTYSFAKEYEFTCLRIIAEAGGEIPSISSVFAPSFLYENEIHDLFGIKVVDMSVDYQGNFYRINQTSPFQ